jgi:hypothetical protein
VKNVFSRLLDALADYTSRGVASTRLGNLLSVILIRVKCISRIGILCTLSPTLH